MLVQVNHKKNIMIQKVIRVGNSAAVTIPKKFIDQTNLQIGDEVEVQSNKDLQLIQIRLKGSKTQASITPEFKSWLEKFVKENKDTLHKLAQL